jgi:hypothetical protein
LLLSLVAGVCDALGFAAALSFAAADWFPPFIDLSEVRGVVAAAERSWVVPGLDCVLAELRWVVEGCLLWLGAGRL